MTTRWVRALIGAAGRPRRACAVTGRPRGGHLSDRARSHEARLSVPRRLAPSGTTVVGVEVTTPAATVDRAGPAGAAQGSRARDRRALGRGPGWDTRYPT